MKQQVTVLLSPRQQHSCISQKFRVVAQGHVANCQHITWEFCKGFVFLEKCLTHSLGHGLLGRS